MKAEILQKLKDDIRFRERRFRLVGIMQLIVEKYGNTITSQNSDDIAGDILSADREWRDILKYNKDLRGKDYSDGKRLSQEEQLRRGYEPGFHSEVKKLQQHIEIKEVDGQRVAHAEHPFWMKNN